MITEEQLLADIVAHRAFLRTFLEKWERRGCYYCGGGVFESVPQCDVHGCPAGGMQWEGSQVRILLRDDVRMGIA